MHGFQQTFCAPFTPTSLILWTHIYKHSKHHTRLSKERFHNQYRRNRVWLTEESHKGIKRFSLWVNKLISVILVMTKISVLYRNIRHVVRTSQQHTGSVLCASALLCRHTVLGPNRSQHVSCAQCSSLHSSKLNATKHSNCNWSNE